MRQLHRISTPSPLSNAGRPKVQYPSNFADEYRSWRRNEITAVRCMDNLGLAKSTFYRLVQEYEKQNPVFVRILKRHCGV